MTPVDPPIHFLNVAYFFQLLYNAAFGAHALTGGGFNSFASSLWLLVTILAYVISLIAIGLLVYYSARMYQVEEEDAKRYTTITKTEADVKLEHSRWAYIMQLIESPQESDWRNAIIEADIMLDEMLTKLGYEGNGVGDKLKSATAARFATLQDAWEAHKVRNDIAHQGSAFELTDHLAYRTIKHYENVFREFNEI